MPPAGRPRSAAHRDLPPRMLRRERGDSVRYYYQHPDGRQIALGGNLEDAIAAWAKIHTASVESTAGTFGHIAREYLQHGMIGLARKTQHEYELAINRLTAVFGAAQLSTIRPVHVGQMLHELRDTPVLANRIKASLSRLWNWARHRGLTDLPNPCAGIEGHTEKPRKILVTAEMFWAIYDEADQVLRDWMRLDIIIGQRVSDITHLRRSDIVTDGAGRRELRYQSTKTGTRGLMSVDGDLDALLDELLTRQRAATGPYLLQTDAGQRVTYAMLRNRFDDARATVKGRMGDSFVDWQMRDLRKTSLNQASTIEEARRRALHTDTSTTARHYEVLIDSTPGRLPDRELLQAASNSDVKPQNRKAK